MVHNQGQAPAGVLRHRTSLAIGAIGPWPGNRDPVEYLPAHALGVTMFHRDEELTSACLDRNDPGAVGAPHEVGGLGDDLALVETGVTAPAPIKGEQVVFPHEP